MPGQLFLHLTEINEVIKPTICHAHAHTRTHAHTKSHTHTHTQKHSPTHTHTHTHMDTHLYLSVQRPWIQIDDADRSLPTNGYNPAHCKKNKIMTVLEARNVISCLSYARLRSVYLQLLRGLSHAAEGDLGAVLRANRSAMAE